MFASYLVICLALVANARAFSPFQRIVGGREVSIVKHPYLISLRYRDCNNCSYEHECGGAIYNKHIVLTAAHCVHNREAKSFMVVAGSEHRTGSDGRIVRVADIKIHEDFHLAAFENDLAVLFLATPLHLNGIELAAVNLASKVPQADTVAVVSGWGRTAEDGDYSDKLQDVEVNIVDRLECDKAYGGNRVTNSMLCAGVKKGGKDACSGDSGGPLLANDELVGIVSWAIGCGRLSFPGVYTNVAHFKGWIERVAKEASVL